MNHPDIRLTFWSVNSQPVSLWFYSMQDAEDRLYSFFESLDIREAGAFALERFGDSCCTHNMFHGTLAQFAACVERQSLELWLDTFGAFSGY